MKRLAVPLVLAWFALGCRENAGPVIDRLPAPLQFVDHFPGDVGDYYEIDSLEFVRGGDYLSFDLVIPDGCSRNEFTLLCHNVLSKSIPPQAALRLIHRARGGTCQGWKKSSVVFDLSELKKRAYPSVLLAVYPYDGLGPVMPLLLYSFP